MNDRDKAYLLKELTKTIDESDSTAAFCLCQRWILKDALALLKEQERIIEYMRKSNTEWCEKNCPYAPDCGPAGVCNQVVSLLKEKEAVLVDTKMIGTTNGSDIEVYCCRDCRTVLDPTFNYCPNWGQEVKWDD